MQQRNLFTMLGKALQPLLSDPYTPDHWDTKRTQVVFLHLGDMDPPK